MRIKTVLFDLDGTLLPMDQELFTKAYFRTLSAKLAPFGYDPEALVKGIWTGTAAMVNNDGSRTNEQAFWDTFCALFGEGVRQDEPHFEEYYREDFQKVKEACGFAPEAAEVVALCREKGWQMVLATNPIFPAVATESRIHWAGLQPEDFAFYTTYENSCHCKPNLAYYRDILAKINCRPEECLMVGNDVGEDMVAKTLGMHTFLLTDCLINKGNADIAAYAKGGFEELITFLKTM